VIVIKIKVQQQYKLLYLVF